MVKYLIFVSVQKVKNMKHLTSEQRYVISALKKRGETLEIIGKEVENIEREDIKSLTKESMEKMKKGQRDFYL